jgi:GNAT superfamily N-acetyltransferase
LASKSAGMAELHFRRATAADLPQIVAMLADDPLGSRREDLSQPLACGYLDAFAVIDASSEQLLVVAVEAGRTVGTLQLTFLPGISRQGAWRGLIEAVRIVGDRRGHGLGEQLISWAIAQCRARGCVMVQLTTDKSREDAHRFYERLGFKPTHLGYKLDLSPAGAGGRGE